MWTSFVTPPSAIVATAAKLMIAAERVCARRSVLGAVLLDAGRPAEAEAVYWEDLRRNPKNGWSLFGLAQALHAQKKHDQAKLAEADFKKVWADSDVTLTASRF